MQALANQTLCNMCERPIVDVYNKIRDKRIDMTLIVCPTCCRNIEKYKLIEFNQGG